MALKPGTLSDYSGSMAEAIEHAFGEVWNERMGTPLPAQMQEDRRMMFVAIAQGVVKHLRDQASAAFNVDVSVEQASPWITSGGNTTSGTHTHSVSVTQSNSSSNRIQSTGDGVVTILTNGEVY